MIVKENLLDAQSVLEGRNGTPTIAYVPDYEPHTILKTPSGML
jgi:hypothetical protein